MISATFIKRPVTAIVVSLVIVLGGVLSLINLPISQYPDITPPVVAIVGNFTGADAQTVEQTVTTPIEVQVNGSPGMMYMQSNSSNDGTSLITVYYNVGTNIDLAAVDVQNRANLAVPVLPAAVQKLGLTVRKRNPSMLMIAAIYSPKGTHNISFIDNYTNIFVKEALSRVPGVGDINVRADDFSMRIWLNPAKMKNLGVTSQDVVAALQTQNIQVASGAVGAPPQDANQAFEYTVTVNSRLNQVADFEDIVVRTNLSTGAMIYVKDVARVELGKDDYGGHSFVDGKVASYLMIYQSPGSNALETADGVYAALANLKQSFPEDIDYIVPFETVSVVRVSIAEVVKTLLIALLLVTLVVFLFLQNWRATLIPVLAIPVSIIGAFIAFIPLGFTVNVLTLFGFVLAIGIVVDDAIVVVEAVQHYIETEKIPAKEATLKAMGDISSPVIAIALILASVFIPVGFMPGIVGKLYQQFAITIAISVIISAFVALTLTPALCSILLKPKDEKEKRNLLDRFFNAFNSRFEKMTNSYGLGVQKLLKRIPLVVIFLICICVATLFLFKNKSTGFIPTEDNGRLYVTYQLPESSSTARSLEVLDSITGVLRGIPEVGHVSGIAGFNVISLATKSSAGTIFCQLKPWDERKAASSQLGALVTEMQQKLSAIKGADILVIPPPAISGLGQTGGFTFMFNQRESTDDIKTFEKNLNDFIAELNKRPEIGSAYSFFTAKTPGYNVTVDREKAERMGVPLADAFTTIQTFLGSQYVNDFTIYGRSFKVMAQADTMFRRDISNLDQYYIRNQSGEMLPLGSLINYNVVENPAVITHYNLFRTAEIDGNAAPGYSSGDAIRALRETADKVLPNGYGYDFSGLTAQEIAAGSSSTIIFGLSLVFVFLLLAALYESWTLPFSVLFAVPLGAFGAILTLNLIPPLTNNIYAQIGLITLIGLAAKNAILIVEYAKDRYEKGMPLVDATINAVRVRLRPILMTSIAFILGVMPLAFATGAGAVSRRTIGWTVLGGMIAATALAIFVVPALFVLISKKRKRS